MIVAMQTHRDETRIKPYQGGVVGWVESSARVLGHPEQPDFRAAATAGEFVPFPSPRGQAIEASGLWTLTGLPRPVDGPGSKVPLPNPTTVRLEISDEAGDSHSPLANAEKPGVSHERPQARRLRSFKSGGNQPAARKQEPKEPTAVQNP